jgi:hypothetical protein
MSAAIVRDLRVTDPKLRGDDVAAFRAGVNRQIERMGLEALGVRPIVEGPVFDVPALLEGRIVARELGAPDAIIGKGDSITRELQRLVRSPWIVYADRPEWRARAKRRLRQRQARRLVAPGSYPFFPDFSGHNAGVDLAALRRAGVWVVMLKLTEGSDFVSDTGVARWREAGRLGFVRIAYDFVRPSSSSPGREARHLLDVLHAAGGFRQKIDRVSCDFEDERVPDGRDLTGWVDEWAAAVGPPAKDLYSYGPYAADHLHRMPRGLERYHHAAYNSTPLSNVPGFLRAALGYVQFTNGAAGGSPRSLPGSGGRCDVNRILIPAARVIA